MILKLPGWQLNVRCLHKSKSIKHFLLGNSLLDLICLFVWLDVCIICMFFAWLFVLSTTIILCSLLKVRQYIHRVYYSWHIVVGLCSAILMKLVIRPHPSSIRLQQKFEPVRESNPGPLCLELTALTARPRLPPLMSMDAILFKIHFLQQDRWTSSRDEQSLNPPKFNLK